MLLARRRGRARGHAVPRAAAASAAASTGSPSPRSRAAARCSTRARCARCASAGAACCRPASSRSRALRDRRPGACVDDAGREFARGLAAYAAEDVARIQGLATRQIAQVLGYSNGDEVIHRDDLVLLGGTPDPRDTHGPPRTSIEALARARATASRARRGPRHAARRTPGCCARPSGSRRRARASSRRTARTSRRPRRGARGAAGAAPRPRRRQVARHARRAAPGRGAARPGRRGSPSSACGRTACASGACASRSA